MELEFLIPLYLAPVLPGGSKVKVTGLHLEGETLQISCDVRLPTKPDQVQVTIVEVPTA